MENNNPQADLLLINEPQKNVNIPFGLGVASTILLLLSFLSEYILSYGLGFIFFATSFILSIVGLVLAIKYKKQGFGYSHQALTKLKSAKWLSIFTLALTSLAIIAAISLLIIIGNNGFGR